METGFTSLNSPLSALKRSKMSIYLTMCSLLLVLLFLYYFYIPPATEIGPEQPIPFSHRIHVSVKQIQCAFCHPYAGRSNHPGIPPVEKCLFCHKYIIPNHPEIRKEHRYFNTRTPTPWRKANYLPEHVLFSHQRHIKKEVTCQECHGAVERMDRIKGVDFKMGFCIACHEKKKANLDCWLACHN
jgi:hypothetical protein